MSGLHNTIYCQEHSLHRYLRYNDTNDVSTIHRYIEPALYSEVALQEAA